MRTLATTLLLLLAFAVPAGAAGWDRVDASGKAHVYRAAAAFGEQGVWAAGYTYGFNAEVWAVGWSDDFGVASTPVAFRGSRGSVQPVAAPSQGAGAALYAVAADRGGAAVASGAFTRRSDSAPHPHLMGADGMGSLAVEPADPAQVGNLYGVALSPTGTAWAVGVSSWDDRGLIMQRTP